MQHVYFIYCIGFNMHWHQIAYFVLMVSLRIYSLTYSSHLRHLMINVVNKRCSQLKLYMVDQKSKLLYYTVCQ